MYTTPEKWIYLDSLLVPQLTCKKPSQGNFSLLVNLVAGSSWTHVTRRYTPSWQQLAVHTHNRVPKSHRSSTDN